MLEKTEGGNQEWIIQRHWQHWEHKTQDEDKQNKNKTEHNTTQHRKIKSWATQTPPKKPGVSP
jgi:hypothetical protein